MPQRDAKVLYVGVRLQGQQIGDFLQGLGQIAVVIEGIDQHPDKCAVALRQIGQRQLLIEVIAQGRRLGRDECTVAVLVIVAPRAGRRRVIRLPFVASRLGGFAGGFARRFGGSHGFFRCSESGRGWRQPVFRVLALEDRVVHQHPLDLLVQLDRRELEQAYRLLQLRRQREMLGKPELECRLHGNAGAGAKVRCLFSAGRAGRIGGAKRDYMRKFSPR